MDALCTQSFDFWERSNMTVGAEDIEDILGSMPQNKTCGRDGLRSVRDLGGVDSRRAINQAHLVWATNQRLENGHSGVERHTDAKGK